MSDNYCLYLIKAPKPYYLLELNIKGVSRQWVIPSREHLGLGNKKRIAFETGSGKLNKPGRKNEYTDHGEYELVHLGRGNLIILNENKYKLEFEIPGKTKSDFYGRYVFLVPSWGRNTQKKSWVLIPTEKK